MATHPPKLNLPYKVGNPWQEEQILAGILVESVHELEIDLDRLDTETRQRAVAVWRRVEPTLGTVEVLGTGLRPGDVAHFGSDPDAFPTAVDPIVERIGRLPELAEPTEDPAILLAAYEQWITRYRDLSGGALASWIDSFAVGDATELPPENGITRDMWLHEITWRMAEEPLRTITIDGRTDLQLFQRARGAWQTLMRAKAKTDAEDFTKATEIVGDLVLKTKVQNPAAFVALYEEQCERISDLAFARFWTRKRKQEGFNLEMSRWAFTHGSDRLQIGISDGYRMVPVYLKERIAAEVAGFYAHLPKANEPGRWQSRTAPTKTALELRRAVQARLNDQAPPGLEPAQAVIVWMKDPPDEICNGDRASYDQWGDPDGLRYDPFEAIVVEGWLGRYTLIGGVYSHEHNTPDYLDVEYILDPEHYDLPDLPKVPGVRHGVPVDISDFAAGPVSPADDDIPF